MNARRCVVAGLRAAPLTTIALCTRISAAATFLMRCPGTGGCPLFLSGLPGALRHGASALDARLIAHAHRALFLSSMPGAFRYDILSHACPALLLSGLPGTLRGDIRLPSPFGPRSRAILARTREALTLAILLEARRGSAVSPAAAFPRALMALQFLAPLCRYWSVGAPARFRGPACGRIGAAGRRSLHVLPGLARRRVDSLLRAPIAGALLGRRGTRRRRRLAPRLGASSTRLPEFLPQHRLPVGDAAPVECIMSPRHGPARRHDDTPPREERTVMVVM